MCFFISIFKATSTCVVFCLLLLTDLYLISQSSYYNSLHYLHHVCALLVLLLYNHCNATHHSYFLDIGINVPFLHSSRIFLASNRSLNNMYNMFTDKHFKSFHALTSMLSRSTAFFIFYITVHTSFFMISFITSDTFQTLSNLISLSFSLFESSFKNSFYGLEISSSFVSTSLLPLFIPRTYHMSFAV